MLHPGLWAWRGRADDQFEGPEPSNRIPGYYAARIPYSTVLRANRPDTAALSAQPPAGAFSALWTPVSSSIDSTHDDPPVSAQTSATPRGIAGHMLERGPVQYTPVQAAAARIITHPDGSIGALTTLPAHRRRGLARWVVEAHLASGRGRIPNASAGQAARKETCAGWTYAIVHEGNEASSALWRSMGWERVFRCASVYRTEDDIAAAVAGT